MAEEAFAIPTSEETVAAEIAVLEGAASGLCDALSAKRAYAAVLEGGMLRFRGASPIGTAIPEMIEPSEHEPISRALSEGTVTSWQNPPGVFGGRGALVVPWTCRGEVLGVGVVVDSRDDVDEDPLVALVGAKTGSSISAHRECRDLARRLTGLKGTGAALDALVETSSDAIKIVDLDGCVRRWNRAAEALYGWSFEEVFGLRMPHVAEDKRLRSVRDIRAIAAAGSVVCRTASHRCADGSRMSVEITAIPVSDADGHPDGVISVARQTGDRSAVAREGGGFPAAVTHGIKGPLTALVGYAQLLARPEIVDDPVRRQRTIKALEDRTVEVNRFADDVLLVSELSHGSIDLDSEPVDLTGLVADVVGRLDERQGAMRFLVDFESSIGVVHMDRRRTDRALEALFTNAAVLAEGSDVTVRVYVDGGWAVVGVSDKGPGMAKEVAEHLFDLLEDPIPDSDLRPGAGMELFLAREIFERQGGRVDVQSAEGAGTVITVRLPIGARGKADPDE